MATRKTPAAGSKPDKLWRDALMRAVKRRAQGKGKPQRLEMIANKCVEAALEGDKEIGDRLDGKAAQSHEVMGQDGGPLYVITGVPERTADEAQ